MSFVSFAFILLFAVVMAARVTVGRRKVESPYVAVLLVSSVVFYGWHVPAYILILFATTLLDYLLALWMSVPGMAQRQRRAILVLSLISNLGLLAFFKYGNFLIRFAEDTAWLTGGELRLTELSIVLPMGISFYTFQTLSYTIDVYRREFPPVRSFWRFFLFVSFFPQLVAGPIVRASEFLPQIDRPRRLRLVAAYEGLWLIVAGYFLKIVCADNLAVYVDAHWAEGYQPETDAVFTTWLAVMFSGQIFADFAGYSSIARGLGYLLGYRFPINFNAPYIAGSFKNFWERWHITLSRWLRDYLYVALGGNRVSPVRTYLNLLAVMLLGGLWHGAAYTFIVWGAIHGSCLALERLLGWHRDSARRSVVVRWGWAVFVQAAVLIAWVFFRSDDFSGAWQFTKNMLSFDGEWPAVWMLTGTLFLLPLVAHHAWSWAEEHRYVGAPSPVARAALAAVMVYAIITLYTGTSAFIYFQF